MDHPGFVCGLQRLRDLLGNRQRVFDWYRTLRDAISEGGTLDQFEDERLGVVRLFDAVDLGDAGVVEAGEDLASRWNRASRSESAAKASGRIFRATSRPSCVSVARYTCPMPPSPMRAVTS